MAVLRAGRLVRLALGLSLWFLAVFYTIPSVIEVGSGYLNSRYDDASLELIWPLRPDGKLVVPFDERGIAVPLNHSDGTQRRVRHPIRSLVRDAEVKWKQMVNRQSKTLAECVTEYKRRYKRLPPKGFDVWYERATKNGVILVDEFDVINREILPFLALPADIAQERVAKLSADTDRGYQSLIQLHVVDGWLDYGDWELSDLLPVNQDIARHLPDMTILLDKGDGGPHIIGEDMTREAERIVPLGQFFTRENITHFENPGRNRRNKPTKACLDSSQAVLEETGQFPYDNTSNDSFSFIYDHKATKNFCQNPSLLINHGAFMPSHAKDSFISPFFVNAKLLQGGGILVPTTYLWSERNGSHVIPWAQRNLTTKLFWRGSTTGTWHRTGTWRNAHRTRLHLLTNSRDEMVMVPLLLEENGHLKKKSYSRKELNEVYMDVGLAGGPIQCEPTDGACEEMREEMEFRPRYVTSPADPYWGSSHYWGQNHQYTIDVDGNGWSGRFQGLLAGGSVVFKATIYPEWNSEWLTPFYHYVPVQHDYSDLYNTMAFFVGTPDGTVKGQDEIAARISRNAVDFVAKHWRFEDMEAYMFRLLLEWARVLNPDRDSMSYHG